MPKKIPILFRYSKQSCFDIFVCLKSPKKVHGLNYYMTNSKSEQTLPECCRAHRHWGKPAPEREHALRIMHYELNIKNYDIKQENQC